MTKVIIKSMDLREETTSKGNIITKQQAAVDPGDGSFPLPFYLTVRSAYKPGEYRLAGSTFRQGRYGDLEIDPYGIKLLPIAANAEQRKTG
ncbi:hypothetical protein F3N42_07260 [Marinihelvus fidelis]|uniref:Uncharacterized protein n=1 Tax=Marinihelvus fidelis TaxID=2613842 RepID=A0A5N0TC25_9GAMM|nr:single-stranded DNA-binding protein [Marinihelvus fidelis]KAA9131964.1 hypothetical protein F3N42_07260 [Marinihelvus fidelis]